MVNYLVGFLMNWGPTILQSSAASAILCVICEMWVQKFWSDFLMQNKKNASTKKNLLSTSTVIIHHSCSSEIFLLLSAAAVPIKALFSCHFWLEENNYLMGHVWNGYFSLVTPLSSLSKFWRSSSNTTDREIPRL